MWSGRAFGFDMQHAAAMLAVDGVVVMQAEAAIGALVSDLGSPEQDLDQAQEQ